MTAWRKSTRAPSLRISGWDTHWLWLNWFRKEWYKAHDKERNAKYEQCRKASDPRGTEDCRNAIDATVHGGSFTKSSPNKSW
ncbi:EexN family lipoprotein [Erwinia persicina]|uniref:EexN family lipoprotein n=1 Tax=Erwinia persicina TaxID=55211 RepID=UPI003B96E041